jgi:hypothetical protein
LGFPALGVEAGFGLTQAATVPIWHVRLGADTPSA